MESVKKGWDVVELENHHIHVVPDFDLISHELTEECACLPRTETILDDEGELCDHWLVTHAAWDGRE